MISNKNQALKSVHIIYFQNSKCFCYPYKNLDNKTITIRIILFDFPLKNIE